MAAMRKKKKKKKKRGRPKIAGPTKKNHHVVAVVTRTEDRTLRKYAKAQGISVGEVIRRALHLLFDGAKHGRHRASKTV
jgi:DNA invertase Pin-like site-specific DNA recombinase